MADVVCVADCHCLLGEGPLWDAQRGWLWWVDIKGRRVERLDPASGERAGFDVPVRPAALAMRRDGTLLLACEAGVGTFDPATGAFAARSALEPDRPGNRANDGKTDPKGRFWIGTMDDGERADSGALYRVDPDWSVTRVADGLGIPNTVTHTRDGHTLLLADSRQGELYALPVEADGTVGERRLFAKAEGQGSPDGSALDAEGFLWNAEWGAGRIVRYASDGTIERVVLVPVSQPSSCAFGGPNLTTLYITSARVGLSAEQLAREPLAGGLFAYEADVAGWPVTPFAG